jgi:hypothetical protein
MSLKTFALSALFTVSAAAAQAADLAPPRLPAPGEAAEPYVWRAQLTAYAWLPDLGSTLTLGGGLPAFHKRMKRSDILNNLDGAIFLNGTLRKDRLLLMGDLTWSTISRGVTLPPRLGGLGIRSKVETLSITALAGYSVIAEPEFVVDLVGGARAWRLEGSIDVGVPLNLHGSKTNSWVEPVLGARIRWQFAPDWSLIGYVDGGGFDLDRSRTWQIYGTLNYRVSDTFYLSAGWRHLSLAYRDGGERLDVDLTGPLVGATLRF